MTFVGSGAAQRDRGRGAVAKAEPPQPPTVRYEVGP